LTILIPLGAEGVHLIQPIMAAILVLLALLYFSYRQTIEAYPHNGGSYLLNGWRTRRLCAALMRHGGPNVSIVIVPWTYEPPHPEEVIVPWTYEPPHPEEVIEEEEPGPAEPLTAEPQRA
jgi:hypothetical protein